MTVMGASRLDVVSWLCVAVRDEAVEASEAGDLNSWNRVEIGASPFRIVSSLAEAINPHLPKYILCLLT